MNTNSDFRLPKPKRFGDPEGPNLPSDTSRSKRGSSPKKNLRLNFKYQYGDLHGAVISLTFQLCLLYNRPQAVKLPRADPACCHLLSEPLFTSLEGGPNVIKYEVLGAPLVEMFRPSTFSGRGRGWNSIVLAGTMSKTRTFLYFMAAGRSRVSATWPSAIRLRPSAPLANFQFSGFRPFGHIFWPTEINEGLLLTMSFF